MMTPPVDDSISYFGRTNYRQQRRLFGIRQRDRLLHCYVIGKTGVGKSTLLATLMRQDIQARRGFALLDPHGDLAEEVLSFVSPGDASRVTYVDATAANMAVGVNPLAPVPIKLQSLAAAGLMDAFKKFWADSWGPRLEHILRNCVFALIEVPGSTMADILRLVEDRHYRERITASISNEQVRRFWTKEFPGYPARFRAEAIAPLQNKVGAFLTDPVLKRVLTSPERPVRFRTIMDNNEILLVNLAKGRIGEDTANLLGALLLSRLNIAALSRADVPASSRTPFYCYLDEFQNFASLTLLTMLSELRKYGLGMVLAHQYLAQLDPAVKDAVIGNVGTLVVFRVGAADAEFLSQEFLPEFTAEDLVRLPNHNTYVKLVIDGVVSRPFSAISVTLGN